VKCSCFSDHTAGSCTALLKTSFVFFIAVLAVTNAGHCVLPCAFFAAHDFADILDLATKLLNTHVIKECRVISKIGSALMSLFSHQISPIKYVNLGLIFGYFQT